MQLTPAFCSPAGLISTWCRPPTTTIGSAWLADADPICGWVLPNHLDAALMAYDAQGTALGEMSVGLAANDQPVCAG